MLFDEQKKVILVKQHRFPHGYVLEIPAGTLEKREEPVKCAFRELEEETGYRAKKMTPLITYYPSIGYNSEIIHCFVASGLKKIADLKLDDDEILSVEKIEFGKLLRMIKSGKIQDSKTICAVLTYAAKKENVLIIHYRLVLQDQQHQPMIEWFFQTCKSNQENQLEFLFLLLKVVLSKLKFIF